MKAIGKHTVFLNYLLLVLDDVVVPHLNGVSIVHTLVSHGLHFESTTLKLVDVPEERARGIGTREDVFSHKVAPDQVFVLPWTTESSNLEEEQAVRLEERLHLGHEGLVVADADVLAHLKASDLVKLVEGVDGDFTVVLEENLDLVLETEFLDSTGGIVILIFGDGHSNAVDIMVFSAIDEPRSPAAAEVENAVLGLDVNELAADTALSVLNSLKGFRAVIGDTT